jgi:hypothetical protein
VLAFRKYASHWRCRIAFHPPWDTAGLIHPDNVIAEERASDGDDATCTMLAPSNDIAPPYFPCVDHEAPPTTDPVFPFPDTSTTDDPEPASNEYPATNPGGIGGAAGVTTLATAEYGPKFPAASEARTRYWYVVFAARPASPNDVPGDVPTGTKFVHPAPVQRSTPYPVTPTSSVAAVHVRFTCDELAALAITFVGAEGGDESGTACVVPVAIAE